MPAIKWSAIERQLDDMDKPELIELLRDLFKSSDTVRTFLAIRVLGGDGGETLGKYHKRVVVHFFPARGILTRSNTRWMTCSSVRLRPLAQAAS